MNDISDCSSAISVNALVFSGGEVWAQDEPDAREKEILQAVPGPSGDTTTESYAEQNVSTYVRVFEDMICTVIREERHLVDDDELALLTVFAHLSYNARFLMVKLLLRKQDTWHRLDTLKYESELGSVSAIRDAIDELCQVCSGRPDVKKQEQEAQETVELAINSSIENFEQEQDKPKFQDPAAPEPSSVARRLAIAWSEREMDLRSTLECLRLDELKHIAKQLKLKANPKKDDLIRDLLGASSSQSTLTDFACKDGVTTTEGRGHHQTRSAFCKLRSQQDRLKELALHYIVKCVRVDEEFFGIIHRVNLVYFRMTQYTPNILVAALLTRFGKRAYPGYDYQRSGNVWPTRQALLDYEEVLILEGRVDTLLSGNVPPLSGRELGIITPLVRFLPTPVTPGNAPAIGEGNDPETAMTLNVKPDSNRMRGARLVKEIFEQVFPRWEDLVMTKRDEDARSTGLERFHYGHVLTRIVCKGSAALGILGEYERELEVLEALLSQKRWRRGQRGKWHERRTIILSRHLSQDEETMERALDATMEGLRDPDTHIILRPKIQRRLRSLENKLKIPVEERHQCDGVLMIADEVEFKAVRLRHRAVSLKLDRTGRCIDANASQHGNQDIKRYYSPMATRVKAESKSNAASTSRNKSLSDVPKGKSLWLGRNGEELTVENLALQRYEEQGFKGAHCETRVIAMLFSLLFWDIIFRPIPGAFETPYQTAPLDIAEDTFYHARKDLMDERLLAIEAGKGVDLVRAADAENRASKTWCVGVRWDLFSTEDLVDIVMCIGGQALSVICRVLCEDYRFGTSGGPDLFLWNVEKGTCKFVEVKGPGDSLQGNQRVWIDILLRAPVTVEICRVCENGDESDKKPNMRTPKSNRKRTKKATPKEEKVAVDMEDADALPTTFDDPDGTMEEQATSSSTTARTLVGPVNLRGTTCSSVANTPSTPLKRKASPVGGTSHTPSKRQRSS